MTPEKEKIYQEIFVGNFNRLYQYTYRKTGNESDADDIMQEVYIALLFHLEGFLPEYPDNAVKIKTWLFRAADNKLLHFWRKNQKLLDMEVSLELLPELRDVQADPGEVEFSLPDWLKPMDKQLIFLKYSGYSLKEIAPRLGITYGACRVRSARLAKELEKYFQIKK